MANESRGGFNVGDVVQLKSGGPVMTVTGFNEDRAICEWFDSKGQVQARAFEQKALTAASFGIA